MYFYMANVVLFCFVWLSLKHFCTIKMCLEVPRITMWLWLLVTEACVVMSLLFTNQLEVLPSTHFCKIGRTTTSSWVLYTELMLGGTANWYRHHPELQVGRGCWYQQHKLAADVLQQGHSSSGHGQACPAQQLQPQKSGAPCLHPGWHSLCHPCFEDRSCISWPPPPGQAGTGQISSPADCETDCANHPGHGEDTVQ